MQDESAFKTKGLVFIGAWDYYQKVIPGGAKAVCAKLQDDEIRKFFEQHFYIGLKYDVFPIVPISQAAAGLANLSHRELVMGNAKWVAHRDAKGVYRFVLKLSSVKLVAQMLPWVSLQYFNFGSTTGSVLADDKTLDAVQHGIPKYLASWMTWAVEGFAPVVLEIAGAKNVVVSIADQQEDEGLLNGIPICRISWRITWTT